MKNIRTLGELRESGYQPKSIKEEVRQNLREKLKSGEKIFEGIIGFDQTVIPDMERAILARHNILLLGLRGQAKTRLARLMTSLLDDKIPAVAGSELNDDPFNPLSRYARDLIKEKGDDTPIEWVTREERYVEKLATPDVSIADLIGDVDPIKAATMKLSYADERVIHFGLLPRSNRSIFVINELPDLQARIQVSLFNILQEGDIQIRGFKLRMPLDILFVFTANPEDYTNRGSIITPLKDRIESQILTHYPISIEEARKITQQEAKILPEQKEKIEVPDRINNILERISFEARESELIDEKSGVSARLSISGYENLVSSAERRMLKNQEEHTSVRIADFWGVVPAITGKVELVYEGEQEGSLNVALELIGNAIRTEFLTLFPDPDKISENRKDPFENIRRWFSSGNTLDLFHDDPDKKYRQQLDQVDGLHELASVHSNGKGQMYLIQELILFGLSEFDVISRSLVESKTSFKDLLADMLDGMDN